LGWVAWVSLLTPGWRKMKWFACLVAPGMGRAYEFSLANSSHLKKIRAARSHYAGVHLMESRP